MPFLPLICDILDIPDPLYVIFFLHEEDPLEVHDLGLYLDAGRIKSTYSRLANITRNPEVSSC